MRKYIYSESDLKGAVINSSTYKEVCGVLKIPQSGGGYRTMLRDIKKYNIDVTHFLNTWNIGQVTSQEVKDKISKSLKGQEIGRASTEEKELERKRKISEAMKANPKAGGLREGSGRSIKTWYESPIAGIVYLRSSYELEYAKWLDENNIDWKQNTEGFEYTYNGKVKRYYPDFILSHYSYVEIKGFKTKQDEAKWAAFPHSLNVLFGTDLIRMGLNIKI